MLKQISRSDKINKLGIIIFEKKKYKLKTKNELLEFENLYSLLKNIIRRKYAGYSFYADFKLLTVYEEFIKNKRHFKSIKSNAGKFNSKVNFIYFKYRPANKTFWSIGISEIFDLLRMDAKKICDLIPLESNKINKFYYAVYKFFSEFSHGVGNQISISTVALKIYRKFFQEKSLIGHSQEAEKVIREAYAGGRCEILQFNVHKGYYYDINSLYPFVMCGDMPFGLSFHTKHYVKDLMGFYHCKVHVPENMRISPLWKKTDKGLIFPVGNFYNTYASCEIENAINNGCEVEIIDGYFFAGREKLFEVFMKGFYERKRHARADGDLFSENIYKLMLNTFSGKWAIQREQKEIFEFKTLQEFIDSKAVDLSDKVRIAERKSISKSKYIIPAISAWTTAQGRVVLWDWLVKVGIEDNLFYFDNDAFVTNQELPTSDKLGDIKLVAQFENAKFHMDKDYEMTVIENGNKIGKIEKMKGGKRLKDSLYKKRRIFGNITKPIILKEF